MVILFQCLALTESVPNSKPNHNFYPSWALKSAQPLRAPVATANNPSVSKFNLIISVCGLLALGLIVAAFTLH